MTDALPDLPTTASVIALLDSIERHGPTAPAVIAFRTALKRKGAEASGAGGAEAIERLLWEIARVDPARSEARMMILSEAWGSLPGWRS